MDSQEIIRSIHQIYDRFKILPNLRLHMIRTAAVAELICDNWKGPKINKADVVAVCLIHDIGNIGKIDFDNDLNPDLMGDEITRLGYWRKVREEIISKYGMDDHKATMRMCGELGINKRVKFLLDNKMFIRNDFTFESDDWELKICAYADQRVGPFGVISLKARFEDAKERYSNKQEHSLVHPKVESFVDCAFKIEKQILSNLSIIAGDMDDESVKPYLKKY